MFNFMSWLLFGTIPMHSYDAVIYPLDFCEVPVSHKS